MLDLKQLRRRLGLTQAEAAKLCGVTKTTWARWEQGVHAPRGAALKLIDMLPALCKTESPLRRGD